MHRLWFVATLKVSEEVFEIFDSLVNCRDFPIIGAVPQLGRSKFL